MESSGFLEGPEEGGSLSNIGRDNFQARSQVGRTGSFVVRGGCAEA